MGRISMVGKKCPHCAIKYGELHLYCSKCGRDLEKDLNRCTEKKTPMCEKAFFNEDDLYCSYCRALTTYASEKDAIYKEINGEK